MSDSIDSARSRQMNQPGKVLDEAKFKPAREYDPAATVVTADGVRHIASTLNPDVEASLLKDTRSAYAPGMATRITPELPPETLVQTVDNVVHRARAVALGTPVVIAEANAKAVEDERDAPRD